MSDAPLPRIQQPCPKTWAELEGNNRKRFCEECGLHVHNLSEMSVDEQSDFLRIPGRKCGTYLEDREMVTLHPTLWRWWDWARRLGDTHRFWRPVFAAVTLVLAMFNVGCATTGRKEATACPAPTAAETADPSKDGKSFYTTGILIAERPLWKRILWPW